MNMFITVGGDHRPQYWYDHQNLYVTWTKDTSSIFYLIFK